MADAVDTGFDGKLGELDAGCVDTWSSVGEDDRPALVGGAVGVCVSGLVVGDSANELKGVYWRKSNQKGKLGSALTAVTVSVWFPPSSKGEL